MNLYKAISLGMFLLGWFQRASKDGKITNHELAEALSGALEQLDIKIDIEL